MGMPEIPREIFSIISKIDRRSDYENTRIHTCGYALFLDRSIPVVVATRVGKEWRRILFVALKVNPLPSKMLSARGLKRR